MDILNINQSSSVAKLMSHSSPQKEAKTTNSSRKPLSSICANQPSSNSSNNLKDYVTKSGKKSKQRNNTNDVPRGKNSIHQQEPEGQTHSSHCFGDIFRSISPSKAFVWRDEWNLQLANNIYPEENDTPPSKVHELHETDLVDSSSLESRLNEVIQKPKSIQRSGPSEDFWTDEMQDLLTLRIANPIEESDDEE